MKINNSGFRFCESKKELAGVVALSEVLYITAPPFDDLDNSIVVEACPVELLKTSKLSLNNYTGDNEAVSALKVTENDRSLIDLLDVHFTLCMLYPKSLNPAKDASEDTQQLISWLPGGCYWLADMDAIVTASESTADEATLEEEGEVDA